MEYDVVPDRKQRAIEFAAFSSRGCRQSDDVRDLAVSRCADFLFLDV
jgi:hypothetical protein